MVLALLEFVAESTPLMIGAAFLQVVSSVIMNKKVAYLTDTFGGGNPPDMWFGINAKDLYDYFGGVGAEGRAAYLDIATWDMMPGMPAYTLLLGSLLFKECKSRGFPTHIVMVFPFTMLCDAIETIGFGHAAKIFPKPLKVNYVDFVSTANMMKWGFLVMGSCTLAILFLMNIFMPPKASEENPSQETPSKKEKTKTKKKKDTKKSK
jgi:hypothetical protein